MEISSDFNFTLASWFLGNVHVKPISTHSAPAPHPLATPLLMVHTVYALNGYLVLLLAALVLEVDDTFLLGGGVFLAGTLASGLLDGLLPASAPEIFQNKLLSCQGLFTHNSFVASKQPKFRDLWIFFFHEILSTFFLNSSNSVLTEKNFVDDQ